MLDLSKDQANAIPFVLVDTNGTEVTGLTDTFTVTVSKAGGAFSASAGSKSELGNGWYLYTATAGECDTDGILALKVTGAGTAQQNMIFAVGDVAADVWAESTRTLTQSGTEITAVVSGDSITIHRGDTLSASLTGFGSLSGYVSLDFTVKRAVSQADTESIILIRKNASGTGDGLLYLNGTVAGTPGNGSITIDDASAGDITIALDEVETDDLQPATNMRYDVQVITATGVTTLRSGTCNVTADVRRAIT